MFFASIVCGFGLELSVRRFWYIIVPAFLVFVAFASWALSSSVGSAPDEDFHLTSIWCEEGPRAVGCLPDPFTSGSVVVPALVSTGLRCYAFDPSASAQCLNESSGQVVSTNRLNAQAYPGGFYIVARILVTDDVDGSVLRIRMASALVGVLILLASFSLHGFRGWVFALIAMAVSVPLAVFFIPSANPTGTAISGVIAFGLAVSALIRPNQYRVKRFWAGLVGVASLAMVAGARWDAVVFCLILLGAGLLVLVQRWRSDRKQNRESLKPRSIIGYILFLALTFFIGSIAAWVLEAGVLTNVVTTGLGAGGGTVLGGGGGSEDFLSSLFYNVIHLPEFFLGFVGVPSLGNLGWFTVSLPLVVCFGTIGAMTSLLKPFVLAASRFERVVLVLFVLAIAIGVLVTLQADNTRILSGLVQPRYFYPLFAAGLVFFAGIVNAQLSARAVKVAVVLASIGHSAALWTNIRRHVTGLDVVSWDLNANVEWWWSDGLAPNSVWLLGTCAFAGAMSVCGAAVLQFQQNHPDLEKLDGPIAADNELILN